MKYCSECGGESAAARAGGRPPAALRLRGLRHDPLPEPAPGGRLRARATRAASCCAAGPSSRAAASGPCRPASWRTARRCRRPRRASRTRRRSPRCVIGSLLSGGARAARRAGARVLPRQPAAGALRRRAGEPGGGAGRAPQDIPWEDIAFRSTDFTLRRYLEDKAAGREQHHFTTLDRRAPPHAPGEFTPGTAAWHNAAPRPGARRCRPSGTSFEERE